MQFKRTLAALMALVMLVGMLPSAVFADDFDEPIIEDVDLPVEEPQEPEIPEETKAEPQEEPEELLPAFDEDTLAEIPEDGYSGSCGDNVRWVLDDSGTLTISGSGDMYDYGGTSQPWSSISGGLDSVKNVVIENGVTSVGAYAFYNCQRIISVSIPDSVKTIRINAFGSCVRLSKLTIGSGVTCIEGFAFCFCHNLSQLYINNLFAWCNISFGDSGSAPLHYSDKAVSVYVNGSLLSELTIPEGIVRIPDYAFSGWKSIEQVNLPDSVQEIGDFSFSGCHISRIYIPKNVVSLGDRPFNSFLSDIYVDSENPVYTSIDGVLFSKDGKSLLIFPRERVGSYSLPIGVHTISKYCFAGSKLTTITVSDSVTYIEDLAFYDADIQNITLGCSVSDIGDQCFFWCSQLQSITFTGIAPNYISRGAFLFIDSTVYYPDNDPSWTPDVMQNYGGNITWQSYHVENRVNFVSIDTLNNQCIRVAFSQDMLGGDNKGNYTVTDSNGNAVSVGSASKISGNVYQLNFSDPMKAGAYTIRFAGEHIVNGSFEISLDLSVYRILDDRNVVIRLSDAIIGCTTAENYSFHTLGGEVIRITSAVSAYRELNEEATNVFRLTTDRALKAGTTYVVETRDMSRNGSPCQGTIAYFTPTREQITPTASVEIVALTNNQSIIIRLPMEIGGAGSGANYIVKNSAGQEMSIGNVRSVGYNEYEINFSDPLKADHYTISSRNMTEKLSGEFDITLDLTIIRIEGNSVIIQLNEPIYGCTDAPNYFVHKLGMSTEITAVDAESVFIELGRELPNVFRIYLPERIVVGQTYIIETRAMALDPNWEHPCQGTIAYFTK